MPGFFQRISGLLTLWLLTLLSGTPAAALTLYEGESFEARVGGYVQTLSGLQRLGFDTADLFPNRQGLNAAVGRLEWRANFGTRASLELHNRLVWRLSSAPQGFAGGLGLGVSAVPERWANTQWVILDENGLFLDHDLDRAALSLYFGFADLTLGRQAITWGISNLFPVADLFTRFSPFELDTAQKPGADALRAIAPIGERTDLDLVIADRGSLADLSAAFRLNYYGTRLDLYGGAGKFWRSGMVMAGATLPLDLTNLQFEVVLPWDIDTAELQLPRATAGLLYFGTDWELAIELHFNGVGVASPDDYLDQFGSDAFNRGESYFVGRYYVGTLLNYRITETLQANAAVITNITDPSVIITPTLDYEIAQDFSLSIGSFLTYGPSPVIALPPRLNSEFGTYGDLYFLRMAAYF